MEERKSSIIYSGIFMFNFLSFLSKINLEASSFGTFLFDLKIFLLIFSADCVI